MKKTITGFCSGIGFSMLLIGIAGMDSESFIGPIAFVAIGAALMFVCSKLEGEKI